MNKNKLISLISPLAFLALGIWVYVTCLPMSRGNKMFPQIVAVLMIVLAIVGIISTLREKDTAPVFGADINLSKLLTCVLSICLYIFLMKKIGFYLDTLLLTAFNTWNMGYRKYRYLAFSSVLITTLVFCAFYFLIKAPLPTLFL